MKIRRIRLKNFCGVDEADVHFAATGVTLIHGPNESGKSTLMTALDVLFDHRDDSRKEEVKRTKNVSRDVGAEVEADIEIGAYLFTYFKRFHNNQETTLKIEAPIPENLSGREAHERVQQILESSVDTGLWQALRILQGGNLQMPTLHDQRALSEALDLAAGQAKAGDKENALIEAAASEYATYYTDTGREREVPLVKARSQAESATAREKQLQAELNALEEDIVRHAELERSLVTLKRSLTDLEAAKERAQETWDRVSKLADNADRAATVLQLANHALQTARNAMQTRTDLVNEVAAAGTRVQAAQSQFDKTTADLDEASARFDQAQAERDSAVSVASRLDAEERVRRADLEFREAEFELIRMTERLQHVTDADNAAAQAIEIVSSTYITEQLRTRIREAEVNLKTAQGILNTASPKLTIKALDSVSIVLGEAAVALQPGQTRTLAVEAPVFARIGSVAEVGVEPGTSADDLRRAVLDAQSALEKLCAQAGVNGPTEAETVWATLLDAKRTIDNRDRIAQEHLRDLTREELANRIQVSRAKVDGYTNRRTSNISLAATVDDCRALLEKATSAAAEARSAQGRAEVAFMGVQEHHTQCREKHAPSSGNLKREQRDLTEATQRLETARALSGDDSIRTAIEEASMRVQVASEALKTAQELLEGSDRESARSFFDAALAAVKTAQERRDAQERDLIGLRTKLDLVGDKGLAEELAEAKRIAFEVEDSLARLQRRAQATKLLYETLRFERDAMRKAYVTPLRDGIEGLGRHVFGTTFRVDVDEKLQVVSRTVDGVTVSIKQLSTGAQEQLGVLTRLAAAAIVSRDGGVPLVFDDALGSTDADRLEAIGAVLQVASKTTQTIIITCAPERYVHVGAQQLVDMRSPVASTASEVHTG